MTNNQIKSRVAKVVSLSMNGVAVVEISRKKLHPIYKKSYSVSKRFKARYGDIELAVGDIVRVVETRPTSRDTHSKIISVEKDQG